MNVQATMCTTLLVCSVACAGDLPRSSPESQGVSSEQLLQFLSRAEQIDSLHSIMILRRGHVIAAGWWAPYRPEFRHQLYSLSKSFTSTAVGLAIAEQKLSLNDTVLQFFPDDAPADPGANLKAMRVSDLLRMSTGQDSEPPRKDSESWTRTFLAHPVPFKPGTHFVYNTPATYMQSAIVQKVTGQTVLDFLTPRLFEPLGIQNPTWELSPQGVSVGGYGLSLRTEDIAKFGQLCLQHGQWNGQQLVPAEWIAAATARQTSNGSNPESDWDQGYGYQFWRCRHNGFRGDGAFGQFCIVLPEKQTVIAITGGVRNMQEVLNVVWDELLPAISTEPLAEHETAAAGLRQKLMSLRIPTPKTTGTRATTADRTFRFPENPQKIESVRMTREPSTGQETLHMVMNGHEQQIACGKDEWLDSRVAWSTFPEATVAVAGGWDSDSFVAKICFCETPFVLTVTFSFAENQLVLNSESNVGFGPTKQPELVGKSQ